MEEWKNGRMEYWKNACPVKCDVGAISTGECWNNGRVDPDSYREE